MRVRVRVRVRLKVKVRLRLRLRLRVRLRVRLLVEVAAARLLADLELLKQVRQHVLQVVVAVAVLHDVARLEGLGHDLG